MRHRRPRHRRYLRRQTIVLLVLRMATLDRGRHLRHVRWSRHHADIQDRYGCRSLVVVVVVLVMVMAKNILKDFVPIRGFVLNGMRRVVTWNLHQLRIDGK